MEYSTQDSVDGYITNEIELNTKSEPEDEIEVTEEEIKNETADKSSSGDPTVIVTELPRGIVPISELKIPSKEMGSSDNNILLSQLETDEKGNSIVTIQVPVDDFFLDDDNDNCAHTTIELKITDDPSMGDVGDDVEILCSGTREDAIIGKNGELILGNYIFKAYSPPKSKTRLPIWKRHTPKPPGSISNYLYPHGTRSPRSRVIIDCPTNIPVPEFKAQLADTSDIVTTLDVAPSTKKRVKELTTNSVSKLFAYPGKPFPCKRIYNLYQRHLTSTPQTHELSDDLELMPIGYSPSIDYSQVKRITRKRKPAEVPLEVEEQGEVTIEVTVNESETASNNIVQSMEPLSDQVVRVVIKPGVVGEDEEEIIVIHDGSDTLEGSASLQHSIEVLLAAAESGDFVKEQQQVEQVFICNEGTYDENVNDPFMTEQIIIVKNDMEEEELCAKTSESS